MAENEVPEGEVKPPQAEQERSSVRNALTKTAKFLFPLAEVTSKYPREDLEEVYPVGKAKKIRAVVTALGGLVDIARYAGVADNVINAVDADSTKTIIKSSLLAAGFFTPNIVHLASKNRFIRETGGKLQRRVANAVLGKYSAYRDSSPKK